MFSWEYISANINRYNNKYNNWLIGCILVATLHARCFVAFYYPSSLFEPFSKANNAWFVCRSPPVTLEWKTADSDQKLLSFGHNRMSKFESCFISDSENPLLRGGQCQPWRRRARKAHTTDERRDHHSLSKEGRRWSISAFVRCTLQGTITYPVRRHFWVDDFPNFPWTVGYVRTVPWRMYFFSVVFGCPVKPHLAPIQSVDGSSDMNGTESHPLANNHLKHRLV